MGREEEEEEEEGKTLPRTRMEGEEQKVGREEEEEEEESPRQEIDDPESLGSNYWPLDQQLSGPLLSFLLP